MDNFEKITQSRAALGTFLRSLPVLSAPWDDEFHMRICETCSADNCDACPHEAERNNPEWWLGLKAAKESGAHEDSN